MLPSITLAEELGADALILDEKTGRLVRLGGFSVTEHNYADLSCRRA